MIGKMNITFGCGFPCNKVEVSGGKCVHFKGGECARASFESLEGLDNELLTQRASLVERFFPALSGLFEPQEAAKTAFTLTRTDVNENRAVGELRDELGSLICLTIERGWLNNARNISCIPQGEYVIQEHISPRFGRCIKVFDKDGISEVQGRSQILFHVGNFVNWSLNGVIQSDTEGCILPVSSIPANNLTSFGVFGQTSRPKMNDLQSLVCGKRIKLIVVGE